MQKQKASHRNIQLGPGIGEPFEVGAQFFAALAFPERNEDSARTEAELAFSAGYLHEANRVDESNAPFLHARLNEIAARRPRWVQQKLRTIHRRLEDRSEAARAVRPWVSEHIGVGPHPPVAGIKKFTMRQIALYLCDQDDDRAGRFQKRVWRPSRPVLHLAIAIDEALYSIELTDNRFDVPIDAVDVFRSIVARSAWLQPRIAADRRFGIDQGDQITLNWLD